VDIWLVMMLFWWCFLGQFRSWDDGERWSWWWWWSSAQLISDGKAIRPLHFDSWQRYPMIECLSQVS
jgi:hypothetical protein